MHYHHKEFDMKKGESLSQSKMPLRKSIAAGGTAKLAKGGAVCDAMPAGKKGMAPPFTKKGGK
jgi:hypothetical protein